MTVPVLENQHQETVRENFRAGAKFNKAYLLMNVLAATIASYGLFANSPAVVIGAMIIAIAGTHCRDCIGLGGRRHAVPLKELNHIACRHRLCDDHSVRRRGYVLYRR